MISWRVQAEKGYCILAWVREHSRHKALGRILARKSLFSPLPAVTTHVIGSAAACLPQNYHMIGNSKRAENTPALGVQPPILPQNMDSDSAPAPVSGFANPRRLAWPVFDWQTTGMSLCESFTWHQPLVVLFSQRWAWPTSQSSRISARSV